MKRMWVCVQRFFVDERGTEALEWGLTCGLIVVGAIVAISSIGPKVQKIWANIDANVK
jgi:Flp pilus assembly pilin Flp